MDGELKLTAPGMTHSQLVQRAVLWLRNQVNCRVVLAEQSTGLGEIPDAIGWKYGTQSHLIECKVSRADFFADRGKAFRCDPTRGMGRFRYYMAPAGILTLEDMGQMCTGWGLLAVHGRRVKVLRKPEAQTLHNQAEEICQLVQALGMVQVRIGEPVHQWITAPDSPYGQMRAQHKELRDLRKENQRTRGERDKQNLAALLEAGSRQNNEAAQ